ncbi:MAG: bifunctional riboflavin kinase/FAD synthetase [Flavobacteriaceae bacterium]|nr:bifunctional riboflavin kinase/FAD synthetase [Flavobacteriaceae bacterium]
MKEHTSAAAFKNERGTVVTIGTFDGVHVGHKAIIKRVVEAAHKEQLDSVLLTFFPHPRRILQKDLDIKLLNTLSEKKELLTQLGLDHLVIHPFTQEFSRLTAVEYVRDILVHQLKVKKVIIGYDHRFGRNRTATIDDLKEFAKTYSFAVEEISAQELDEVAVSSTKIRKALEEGDIETATRFLGYGYRLHGTVIKGKQIGKSLGYPTANLKVDEAYKLIPKNGVYITQATIEEEHYFGLTSIGTNPTVGGKEITIETYFLDFNKEIYGKNITVEFITHIRDEETFKSLEELKEAIVKDELFARNYLAGHE